jgi:hypothetical protein
MLVRPRPVNWYPGAGGLASELLERPLGKPAKGIAVLNRKIAHLEAIEIAWPVSVRGRIVVEILELFPQFNNWQQSVQTCAEPANDAVCSRIGRKTEEHEPNKREESTHQSTRKV